MINPMGQFGLGKIGGATGTWIKLGQWMNGDLSPFEHAFMYTGKLGDGQFQAVEAMPGGAVKTERWSPLDVRTEVSSFDLSTDVKLRVARVALARVGTPYSFIDYASLALLRLGIRPGWLKRYVASDKREICSEMVDGIYLDAGVHLYDDGRPQGDVTPGDLWRDFIKERRQPAKIDPS